MPLTDRRVNDISQKRQREGPSLKLILINLLHLRLVLDQESRIKNQESRIYLEHYNAQGPQLTPRRKKCVDPSQQIYKHSDRKQHIQYPHFTNIYGYE